MPPANRRSNKPKNRSWRTASPSTAFRTGVSNHEWRATAEFRINWDSWDGAVLDRPAAHHVPHRQLDDLAALGAGNIRRLDDLGRHVTGSGVVADLALDAGGQGIVQPQAILQPHEQRHSHVPLPILADHQAFHHLWQPLHLTVDFRGADTYPAGIEHGVGAAEDHHAAVLGTGHIIAMISVPPEMDDRHRFRLMPQ